MQTTYRHHAPDLIDVLQEAPWRFGFMQLVTLLLRQLRSQGVTGDQAFRDVLRFHNSLSLSFPASEVSDVAIQSKGRPGETVHHEDPCDACIHWLAGIWRHAAPP